MLCRCATHSVELVALCSSVRMPYFLRFIRVTIRSLAIHSITQEIYNWARFLRTCELRRQQRWVPSARQNSEYFPSSRRTAHDRLDSILVGFIDRTQQMSATESNWTWQIDFVQWVSMSRFESVLFVRFGALLAKNSVPLVICCV